MSLSEAFAVVLKKHRLERGLSQEALAKKARLHQTGIGFLERAERSPSIHTLESISKALDIPVSTLISEAEKLQKRS
jgi:transcriptional regulator with XRE-family HTH domain